MNGDCPCKRDGVLAALKLMPAMFASKPGNRRLRKCVGRGSLVPWLSLPTLGLSNNMLRPQGCSAAVFFFQLEAEGGCNGICVYEGGLHGGEWQALRRGVRKALGLTWGECCNDG